MMTTDAVRMNFQGFDMNSAPGDRPNNGSSNKCTHFPCSSIECELIHEDYQWAVNTTIDDLLIVLSYWSKEENFKNVQGGNPRNEVSMNHQRLRGFRPFRGTRSESSGRGTGFGGDQGDSRLSIDRSRVMELERDKKMSYVFQGLSMLLKNSSDICSICERIKECAELSSVICALWKNDSLMDIASKTILYQSLSELMSVMLAEPLLLPYIFEAHPHCSSASIASLISALNDQVTIFLNFNQQTEAQETGTEVEEVLLIALHIQQLFQSIQTTRAFADEMIHSRDSGDHLKPRHEGEDNSKISAEPSASTIPLSSSSSTSSSSPVPCEESWKTAEAKEYVEVLQPMRFEAISLCDMIDAGTATHAILNKKGNQAGGRGGGGNSYSSSASGGVGVVGNPRARLTRIASEISSLSTALPVGASASIFLRCDEARMDVLKALVIGPEGTPYENGCFEFDILLSSDYPNSPPSVLLVTTGGGTMRFNPNLYNCGKVCLSLLGTWTGPGWDPKTSTLLQVLVSIQSLIMVPDPFYNEPAHSNSLNKLQSDNYNVNIRRGTLEFAILGQMQKPSAVFADVIREHFRIKKRSLARQLVDWSAMATVTASSSSHSRPYYVGMSSSSHSTHEHTAQIVSNIRRVAQLEGVEADYKPKDASKDASVNQSLLFNSAVKAIDPPDTEKKKHYLSHHKQPAFKRWGPPTPTPIHTTIAASIAALPGTGAVRNLKDSDSNNAMACCNCSKRFAETKVFVCKKCQARRYCSRNCQYVDFPYHKQFCSWTADKAPPGLGSSGRAMDVDLHLPIALPFQQSPVTPPFMTAQSAFPTPPLPPPVPSPLPPLALFEAVEEEDDYFSDDYDYYSFIGNEQDDDVSTNAVQGNHAIDLDDDADADMQAVLQYSTTASAADAVQKMEVDYDAEMQAALEQSMMYPGGDGDGDADEELQAVLALSMTSSSSSSPGQALQQSMMYGGGGGDTDEELNAVLALSMASSSSASSSSSSSSAGQVQAESVGLITPWQCAVCTFLNDGGIQGSCAMCDSVRV